MSDETSYNNMEEEERAVLEGRMTSASSFVAQEAEQVADVSSAEEERQMRTQRKSSSWRKGLPESSAITAMIPKDLSGSAPTQTDVEHKTIMKLEQLLEHMPFVNPSKIVCSKAAAKLVNGAGGIAAGVGVASAALRMSREQADQWQLDLLREKERALITPEFYLRGAFGARLTQEELTGHIRQREMDLPLVNADLMEQLLQQAGTFYSDVLPEGVKRTFPACRQGEKCVGMLGIWEWKDHAAQRPPKGIVFTSLMFTSEFMAFVERGVMPPERECVACCIHRLTEFILVDRAMIMNSMEQEEEAAVRAESSSSSSSSTSQPNDPYTDLDLSVLYGRSAPQQRVSQIFRNPVDCEGGFFREYMLCDPDAYEVFIDPVLRLNASTAFLYTNKHGRICLNIDMMRWYAKAAEQPRMGEKLSVF